MTNSRALVVFIVIAVLLTCSLNGVVSQPTSSSGPILANSRAVIKNGFNWTVPLQVSTQKNSSGPEVVAVDDGPVYITYCLQPNTFVPSGIFLSKVLPNGTFSFRDKMLINVSEQTPIQLYDILDEFTQYIDIDTNGFLHTIATKGFSQFDQNGSPVLGPEMIDLQTYWTDYSWGNVVGPNDVTYIFDTVPPNTLAISSVAINGSFMLKQKKVTTSIPYSKIRFVVDSKSNIYAVVFSFSSSGIYDFLKIDPSGKVLQTTRLATGIGYTTPVPDIAYSPDGRLHIVWASASAPGTIKYMRLDTDGNIEAGPFDVNTGSDINSGYPRVGADPGGNAYVVWPDGGGSILLTRINKGQSTSPGWSEAVVSGVNGANLPEIAVGNNGDVHLVYIGGKFANQRVFYVHGALDKDFDAYFNASEKTKAAKVFAGDKVIIDLTLSNNGTLNDTYRLNPLTSTQTGWSANFPADTVFVSAGTTVQISLTISAPASAQDHELFWSQVQVLSTNYTELSITTEKLTSEAVVDHKISLDLPSAQINGSFGVPLLVNFSVNNEGHAKEFLNLSAKGPANWSVDIGKGPGMFRKMTLELGASLNISMKVVPSLKADAGLSPVTIKVIYDINSTLATSGTVQVQLPVVRSLTLAADRTNMTARSYSPAVFVMTVGNDDNTGASYKIKMEYYCDFSSDILNVTFSQNDFIVQARAKALVLVNITSRMGGSEGLVINVTIYASTENAIPLQASQNLSLTMGRSLLVIQSPLPQKATEPGKTAAFDFTMINVGDFDENITWSILTLPNGWNSSLTLMGQKAPPTISLPAGATVTGVVYITLALGKNYVGQNISFALYAKYGHTVFGLDLTVRVIDLTTNNSAPTFNSVPANKAIAGKHYLYQIKAMDKDTDLISYSIVSGPQNMSIDQTGLVNWTPTESEIGTHKVVLRISDGKAQVDQSFSIEVISSKYGHGLNCNIANPSDGDTLKGPARISGTATFTDVGGYVEVSVDNGGWTKAKGAELWYLDLDTSSMKKGEHTVSARAVSGTDLSNTVTVHVNVKKTAAAPKESANDYLLPFVLIMIILILGILLLARRRLTGAKVQASPVKARPDSKPPRPAAAATRPAPRPVAPTPLPPVKEQIPEIDMEEEIEPTVALPMEEPVEPAPEPLKPKEAQIKRPPPVVRPRAPPPKDQKLSGELAELEAQFEAEEKTKASVKKAPDKTDTDLDDILRKLSEPSSPKKGGGAK